MTFSSYPTWLLSFYSGQNEIELEKQTEGVSDSINLLILKSIRNLTSRRPYFLPAYVNGNLFFYGICPDIKSLNELKSSLYYGLGSSHTSAYEIIKSSNLQFEQSLLLSQPHGVIRFAQVIKDNLEQVDTNYIVQTLNEVSARFEAKPKFTSVRMRPIGRILRDFFLASRESDGEGAFNFYNEAKGSHKLSHRNLVGLEIQSLAINASWNEILDHENLSDYLAGIVPTRIYHLLIRALMHVNKLDLSNLSNVDWVSLKLKLDGYGESLLSKPRLKVEEKYKDDWEIWAAMATTIGVDRKDITSLLPSFISENWVNELFKKIESFIEAHNALPIESTRLQALFDSPISIDVVAQVLDYSKACLPSEVGDIFNWLEELPFEIRQKTKASPSFRKLWGSLEDYIYGHTDSVVIEEIGSVCEATDKTKGSVINSWNDWFTHYSSGGLINFDLISEWQSDEFDIKFITEVITTSSDAENIRNIAPHLLSWMDDHKVETTSAFWLGLIELIALDDETSYITIGLMKDLIHGLLNTPHSKEQYASAIEAFEVVVKMEISRKSLPVIIEFSEMLFDYAIKSHEKVRYQLWNDISQYSITNWFEIDFELRTVLIWLDKNIAPGDNSFNHLVTEDNTTNEITKISLKDKLIGISTLTEKAGQRAAEMLQSLFPGVEIKLNHDKVATDKLKNLASSADYFIFCNKSAAHQSYYAVKAINKDIIYCDGKGSSSIIRALTDAIN
jgi:hypothetical protein